jgi:N6-adenosine-specific RNA methylase IME4
VSDWFWGDLKRNHYKCVLVDPPTKFIAGTKGRPQHYPRMRDDEIAALPIADLLAEHAYVFLWVTTPKLYKNGNSKRVLRPDEIAKAWGLRYSGNFLAWIKLNKSVAGDTFSEKDIFMGGGYSSRKNLELCLLFRKGEPKRLARDVREVIISPRREHSRKPDEQYERIERFCEGPRLELFARASRPGWAAWGNEKHLFDKVA